uniref:Ligand dependent nuclear receptor interacting factor 1 n=1 Tax=Lates calcarifer TaxID=8187 RepID=A0A4W6CY17_LATCA
MFLCSVVFSFSGTGVFYQAIPAVGADGRNIMKLIPVEIVNGRYVQNQISKPRMDSTPQKAVSFSSAPVQMVKKTALSPSATQQLVRKEVSFVSALPHQVQLNHGNSLNKHPPQQQTVNFMAKVPLIATPATSCGNSVRPPARLPVTVKSPALPRGQYLQIPSNAQVRTVPASELPPDIKKQIFTSSADSSPCSGLPSVVYVSPVMTMDQGVDSGLHSLKLPSKTSNKASYRPPAKGSKPPLKLIPKVSQRPNSPIKWEIEEENNQTATSSLNSITEEKSLDGRTGDDGRDDGSALNGKGPDHSTLVSTVKNITHVCGSAVMNMHNNGDSSMENQQSASIQQVERMETDEEIEADNSSGSCSQKQQDTRKMEVEYLRVFGRNVFRQGFMQQ